MTTRDVWKKIDEAERELLSIMDATTVRLFNARSATAGQSDPRSELEQALTNMGKPEKIGTPDITMLRKAWRLSAACRALYAAIEEALEGKEGVGSGTEGD